MKPDRLYELAFQYKRTKLWKKLYDSDIFAVKFSDGEIGYCCVMGRMGDYISLGVYVGAAGWHSYRRMLEITDAPEDFMLHEVLHSQDCIQCVFENKMDMPPEDVKEVQAYARKNGVSLKGRNAFPAFTRFRPGRFPWGFGDEKETEYMIAALEAALEVSERLEDGSKSARGFVPYSSLEGAQVPLLEKGRGRYQWGLTELPPPPPPAHPAPGFGNEILKERVRRASKRDTWECALAMMPTPVRGEEDEAPYFPFLILMVESVSGFILPTPNMRAYPDEAGELVEDAAAGMVKNELFPEVMLARDARTAALLGDFCAQTGIRLITGGDTPMLDEAHKEMIEHFMRFAGDDEDDEDDMDDEEDEEGLYSLVKDLIRMGVEDMSGLPEPVIKDIVDMLEAGVFPPEIEAKLRRALRGGK